MIKLLVDTCVWLGLARDHRQQPLLSALEELIRAGEVSIILPQTVVDEFDRNKGRIVEESARSHSAIFRRVKDAVAQFGEERTRSVVLQHLNEIDHRIGTL